MKPAYLLLAASCLFLVAADAPDKDAEKLQGTWKVIAAVKDGEGAPADDIEKMELVISSGQMVFKDGKSERDETVTFKVDSTKQPATIDMTNTKEKKLILGIYKLDGDKLSLCFRLGDKDRPTEFASKKKSDVRFLTLERVKKP